MKAISAVLAALLLIHTVQGYSLAAWYSCDRTRCLRPMCQCASEMSALSIQDTPQFVVISNDDQVNLTTMKPMAKLVATANNTNGCPIPVTWFTRSEFSTCQTIRARYQLGDEFASHAVKHIRLTEKTSSSEMLREITGARDYLYRKCGLPVGSVKGYRAAYRSTNPKVRQMVADNGFTYDSTIGFELAEMDERPFPFTMNNAIPDPSCKTCLPSESYSSVWQIPLWALQYQGQVYPMDPGMARRKSSQAFSSEAVLRNAFDQAYFNNRAPVPVAVHPYWFTESRSRDAQNFITYALSQPDVYFVTMSQLIQWMEDPVPAREMGSWLKARCQNKPLRRTG